MYKALSSIPRHPQQYFLSIFDRGVISLEQTIAVFVLMSSISFLYTHTHIHIRVRLYINIPPSTFSVFQCLVRLNIGIKQMGILQLPDQTQHRQLLPLGLPLSSLSKIRKLCQLVELNYFVLSNSVEFWLMV